MRGLGVVAPAVLVVAACASGDEGVPEALADRLTAATEEVETADGLHLEMHLQLFDDEDADERGEADVATCISASVEPEGTSEAGDRLSMRMSTLSETHGCLASIDRSFTVDGNRVYAHTTESHPDRPMWMSDVGEVSPELMSELAAPEASPIDVRELLDSATGVDEVNDHEVVIDLDPSVVTHLAEADVGAAGAAADDLDELEGAVDSMSLTAVFDPDAPDTLTTLEYEVTTDGATLVLGFHYEDIGQPQGVDIPDDAFLNPGVTELTSPEELAAFVGFD